MSTISALQFGAPAMGWYFGHAPFPLLSDPRGDLIKTLDLWNEEEGVSEPAIVVLGRTGTVRRLYSGGRDFSDRPTEAALFAVLDEVSTEGEPERAEPEFRISAAEAERESARPGKPALTLEQLGPYYLGTYYATVAMQKKLDGERGKRLTAIRRSSRSTTPRSGRLRSLTLREEA